MFMPWKIYVQHTGIVAVRSRILTEGAKVAASRKEGVPVQGVLNRFKHEH